MVMTYEEARNSGLPFNRSCYKDDYYVADKSRNVDYAIRDLSRRDWTEEDLKAIDWEIKHEEI